MAESKPTILYVDDDPDYREALRTILEAAGYDMIEAATAEEGLRVYRDNKPSLVIVDLMMEEIDSGTAFVKEMRAAGNHGVPIYMLSSVGDNLNQQVEATDLGLAGVFQKPIDRNTILTVLKVKLGV